MTFLVIQPSPEDLGPTPGARQRRVPRSSTRKTPTPTRGAVRKSLSTTHTDRSERSPAEASPDGTWQRDLADAVRDPDELLRLLGLPNHLAPGARQGAGLFPVVVPRSYLARIRPQDPTDPLLRQVLPLEAEGVAVPNFVDDPLNEYAAQRAPGLLQKYRGRVLLVAATSCAVHCRYCFRRHFPYESAPRGLEAWGPALETIGADKSIEEVILSGGDPLILTDHSLDRLFTQLEAIPHLKRLRIHTRLPIVLPSRLGSALLKRLRAGRLTPFLVVHANHAAELVGDCAQALGNAVDAGIPTLNQTVLLRGVNDTIAALTGLSRRLVNLRVVPYYLHQLDHVHGAAHFHVPEKHGRELVAALRRELPGYAVPLYVTETPGQPSKTPIELRND